MLFTILIDHIVPLNAEYFIDFVIWVLECLRLNARRCIHSVGRRLML